MIRNFASDLRYGLDIQWLSLISISFLCLLMLRYYLHEVIGSYRANVPGETIDARHHSTSYGPGPSEAPSMSFVKCGTPRGHSFLSPTDFS
uniref:Uncharacterized protein n=1 Tax=Caenorhabditis japonica TaxID=281687 RepID=A0A8R1E7K8_CAEJA